MSCEARPASAAAPQRGLDDRVSAEARNSPRITLIRALRGLPLRALPMQGLQGLLFDPQSWAVPHPSMTTSVPASSASMNRSICRRVSRLRSMMRPARSVSPQLVADQGPIEVNGFCRMLARDASVVEL